MDFSSIVQSIPDIVYRLDADGRFTFISRAVKRYGWNPEELIGHHFLEIVHPDDRDKAVHRLDERRTGERRTRAYEIRLLIRSQNGKNDKPSFLLDAEGLYLNEIPAADAFFGSQGLVREVSGPKMTVPAGTRDKYASKSLAQTSPALYVAFDSQWRILSANPSFLSATGYREEEILGRDYISLFVPLEEQEPVLSMLEGLIRNESGGCIHNTILARNGEKRKVDWFGRALYAVEGSLDYIFGFGVDITQLERNAVLLRRRKEFETLIASIATGFINILPEKADSEIIRAFEKIGSLLNVDCCLLYRFDEQMRGMDLTHEWHTGQFPGGDVFPQQYYPPSDSWVMGNLKELRTILALHLDDLPTEAERAKTMLAAAGVRSVVIAPLLFAGELKGMLGFYWARETAELEKEDIALIETAVHIISNAIQNMLEHALLEEYRTAVESVEDMITVVDENYTYRLANWSYLEFVGKGREQVVGHTIAEVVGEELFENQLKPRIDRTLAGEGMGFDSVRYHKSLGERVIRLHQSPMPSRDGRRALVTIIKDITEKQQMLEALQHSEKKYRHLVENISELFIALDREGRFTYISPAVDNLFGYSPEEVTGLHFIDFIYPEDRERVIKSFEKELDGQIDPLEYRVVRRNGEERWVYSACSQIFENGRIAGIQGVISDITERKTAEMVLKESEEKYRLLIENLGAVVALIDHGGAFHMLNSTAAQSLGGQPRDYIGRTIWDVFPADAANYMAANIHKVIDSDQGLTEEMEAPLPDGNRRWFRVNLQPYRIPRLQLPVVQLIAHDITELKKLEEERTKAGKLESIGILAGGLAHDFNNILTSILGNITLARLHPGISEDLGRILSAAEKSSLRARDLTSRLLTFSRGGAPVKRTLRLGTLLRECVELAARGLPVDRSCEIPPDLPPVNADEGQIRQVIGNLCRNSVQAMPEGGALTIETSAIALNKGNECSLPAGNYVRITVRDTGHGITAENLPKIFDPYFSTRPGGTGIGLATSYSIIKRHGGCIRAESTPGKGSAFHVILPACMDAKAVSPAASPAAVSPPAAAGPAKPPERRAGRSARILMLDDETQVLKVTSAMLEHLGHQVTLTDDGAKALAEFEKARGEGKPFDLLIMDLNIPGGMGGKETIARLIEIDPEVKAIVASGYSNDPILSDHEKYGFAGIVNKPFRLSELKQAIEQITGKAAD